VPLSARAQACYRRNRRQANTAQANIIGLCGKPGPRDILRNAPFGRITFANTDLIGGLAHRNSILEAYRAVGQLLDQVLVG